MPDKNDTFRLIVSGPGGFSAEYEVPVGITTIGRDDDNSIQLDDRTVSRHHARLESVTGECDIIDLGSANGTFVNKVKIPPNTPVPLHNQDQIGLGPNFDMLILMAEGAEEAPVLEEPEYLPPVEVTAPAQVTVSEGPPPPEPPPGIPPPLPSPEGAFELIPPGLSIYSSRLLKFLPGIYHTDFMARFLGIFEATLAPIEWTIDNFDLFLSPRTAPALFLPWLANWFEVEFDKTWSEKQLRLFLEEAWLIYARRGTKWSLCRVLEIYTHHTPIIDDLAEDLRPHEFRVTLPVSEDSLNRASVEALINYYKPAHTDYELFFQG